MTTATEILRLNLARIRRGKAMSRAALSRAMAAGGRTLPPLSLARVESGRRQIDVDDLLGLAVALDVTPVDLLIPGPIGDEVPWRPAPAVVVPAGRARAWIGGRALLHQPVTAAELAEVIRWMPAHRAREVARAWSSTPAAGR